MIIDFCNDWSFCKKGEKPVPVDLPHDAMLLEQRDGGCRNGINSGYFPGGRYVYEKIFDLSAQDLEKSIVIHFEGVYQNCAVFVNGRRVGGHKYGYTAFDVDISDAVHVGSNKVTVDVDNTLEPNCRWYSGSGIYRPVQLQIHDRIHIEKVHIETVSIEPTRVRVDVAATAEVSVTVEIYDGGQLVVSGEPGVLTVPDAKLRMPKQSRCSSFPVLTTQV